MKKAFLMIQSRFFKYNMVVQYTAMETKKTGIDSFQSASLITQEILE